MTKHEILAEKIESELAGLFSEINVAQDEVTVECGTAAIIDVLHQLNQQETLAFDQLIDLCGVDYLRYGAYDWETQAATEKGFSRGVERNESKAHTLDKPRFAVVYHLLSTTLNHRIRVKVFLSESHLILPTACGIWKSANWFEREAYDLYGILFDGHPDLRRILTDYGFIGHPFRKDFPLSGHVEMRYDAYLQKVIYEPVDIEPRVLVPKVIREDNRYLDTQENQS